MTRRARRLLRTILILPLAAVGGCALAMVTFQERFIFPGAYMLDAPAEGPPGPGVASWWITAEDGSRVEAWYQAGDGCTARDPCPAVMYFHGNGDLISSRWDNAATYLPEGVSFLAVEYRGYGSSGGSPSQKAIVADATAFHDLLVQRPEVDTSRIIYHGLSLGGGVAVALAGERPPAAMVLECTFSSMKAMAAIHHIPGWMVRHPFESEKVLASLDVPVLIFHGARDHLIPIEQGRRLRDAARRGTFTELNCGHNDFRSDREAIRRFLEEQGMTGAEGDLTDHPATTQDTAP